MIAYIDLIEGGVDEVVGLVANAKRAKDEEIGGDVAEAVEI